MSDEKEVKFNLKSLNTFFFLKDEIAAKKNQFYHILGI